MQRIFQALAKLATFFSVFERMLTVTRIHFRDKETEARPFHAMSLGDRGWHEAFIVFLSQTILILSLPNNVHYMQTK